MLLNNRAEAGAGLSSGPVVLFNDIGSEEFEQASPWPLTGGVPSECTDTYSEYRQANVCEGGQCKDMYNCMEGCCLKGVCTAMSGCSSSCAEGGSSSNVCEGNSCSRNDQCWSGCCDAGTCGGGVCRDKCTYNYVWMTQENICEGGDCLDNLNCESGYCKKKVCAPHH